MAVVLVLVGGVMGFACAGAALIITDIGLLGALAVWMSGGLAATLLALTLSLLPHPASRAAAQDAPA